MTGTALNRQVSLIGLAIGVLLWLLSLTPTLIPRGWAMQGITGGICLAIGYAIGSLVERSLRSATGRRGWHIGPRAASAVMVLLLLVGAVGMVTWLRWQDEARAVVSVPSIAWWEGPPMLIATAAVAAGLVWVGDAVGSGIAALHRRTSSRFRGVFASAATATMVLAIAVTGTGIVTGGAVATARVVYEVLDQGTNPGIEPSGLASVSGGPGSLVAWDKMGRWGRDFTALTTSLDAMRAFHGTDAIVTDPVRVFVGMRSGGSVEDRAALAVRELERAGAFERSVLAVWVPGGSGWMDPNAALALEQLHAGDTAIVALQYSYLPSFFSQVMDASRALEAGRVLFDAVHDRWARLRDGERPRLILFGASLGAGGAEAPFVGPDAATSIANLAARADGALLVGSLKDNPILRQVTNEREPGSPSWRPVHGGGTTVRFMTGREDIADARESWGWPRILFLQHPSDPVSSWSIRDIVTAPEWMREPRGPGVAPVAGWVPIVSAVQAAADLSYGASLPSGFGHEYRVDYVEAFARLVPPEGWNSADTVRLEAFIAELTGVAAP